MNTTAYRVTLGAIYRYVASVDRLGARYIARQAFNATSANAQVEPMARTALSTIGCKGYDRAANSLDMFDAFDATRRNMRAMQNHNGADNTGRNMFKPSEKQKTKNRNRARNALHLLGIEDRAAEFDDIRARSTT